MAKYSDVIKKNQNSIYSIITVGIRELCSFLGTGRSTEDRVSEEE